MILGLTDLDDCLEGGFIYPSEKVMLTSDRINASVIIILEVLHLLVDLFMANNVSLKVVVLVLIPVLEGAQLLIELPCLEMGKLGPRNVA